MAGFTRADKGTVTQRSSQGSRNTEPFQARTQECRLRSRTRAGNNLKRCEKEAAPAIEEARARPIKKGPNAPRGLEPQQGHGLQHGKKTATVKEEIDFLKHPRPRPALHPPRDTIAICDM